MTSITRRHLVLDTLAGAAVAGLLSKTASASSTSAPGNKLPTGDIHDFDFFVGNWESTNRRLRWLDGRHPARALDPPLKGRFANAGTFYAEDTFNGRPIRVRYIWSQITPTSAHWEQAFSPDGGQTWETNWIGDFKRATAGSSHE